MPKSQFDWLTVASLWLGAVIMAIKAADFPLVAGAPAWFAANWWNYIPVALVSIFLVVALAKAVLPLATGPRFEKAKFGPYQPDLKQRAIFGVSRGTLSKWVPDMTLAEAADYLVTKARWRRSKIALDKRTIESTLKDALRGGKLTAWAKNHPNETDEHQVNIEAWGGVEFNLEHSNAYFPRYHCNAYKIRLAKGELEAAFPQG